jgi:hypothetical protein
VNGIVNVFREFATHIRSLKKGKGASATRDSAAPMLPLD